MEFIWGSPILASIVVILCFCYYLLVTIKIAGGKTLYKKSPPQAAGAWPLIGHINLLSGPELPHITLSNLADKYGPIFGIRLGVHPALIVSSWEIAKECFTTNDLVFSNRPKTKAIQLMGYNFAMFGFDSYGPYWREMRRIATLRLLSNHRVSMLGNVRENEIREMMKSMYKSCRNHEPVEMKKCFADLTLGMMVRTVAGSVEKIGVNESVKWRGVIREFFNMMEVLTISDLLPFLKWMDYFFGGTKKALKKAGKKMDEMLQTWLEQHKKLEVNSVDGDFMDEMIGVADSVARDFPRYDADTITKATCQTMMLAGTDATTITLTWALCLLLNNPHTLKRAQQELETNIKSERQVKESDVENLIYIKAIIKETMRLYPPTALMPPRESSEDCVLSGYHVPAGTRLIINLSKLQRDPNIWSDPLEFKPERFLEQHKEVDVRGQHFELIPFGCGRRACMGVFFALRFMEFTLATLLHEFNIETSTCEAIDMRGSFGPINAKATPIEVLLTPRLSPNVYATCELK